VNTLSILPKEKITQRTQRPDSSTPFLATACAASRRRSPSASLRTRRRTSFSRLISSHTPHPPPHLQSRTTLAGRRRGRRGRPPSKRTHPFCTRLNPMHSPILPVERGGAAHVPWRRCWLVLAGAACIDSKMRADPSNSPAGATCAWTRERDAVVCSSRSERPRCRRPGASKVAS
jgi:hypothetical protein